MKNRIVFFFCIILFVPVLYSQNTHLTIEGSNSKFYLIHSVIAKENWYSIGRLYNLPPHDIANYNNLPFDKALEIAQQIQIPLTNSNFDQKQIKITGITFIPIYHVVQDKEWMYRISSIYNDVPVTSLEKWNKLKSDQVKHGMELIIGYLKVKSDLSPLALESVSSQAVVTSSDATKKTSDPAIQSATKQTTTTPVVQTGTKPAVIAAGTPADQASVKSTGTGIVNTTTTPVTVPLNSSTEHVNNYAVTHSNGGFFSNEYSGGGKSNSGQAGTFKSTSGWTDGKYYALMNAVAVGTIIRVSGNNGKTIYAKVLGQLPDMKESNGLIVRISNAASAEMGLGEGKFPVEIKY